MVLAVVAGTLFDIVHKGSARYFFANMRKSKDKGRCPSDIMHIDPTYRRGLQLRGVPRRRSDGGPVDNGTADERPLRGLPAARGGRFTLPAATNVDARQGIRARRAARYPSSGAIGKGSPRWRRPGRAVRSAAARRRARS